MGSTTPLKFKQGLDENLEQVAHDEGTVYIAKAGHNRAFMYADLDNVRYNITTPNKTYYGVSPEVKPDEPSNDNWQRIKTVTCDDFVLEQGATITVLFSSSLHLFNATLNVSNSGAIPIAYRGEVSSKKFLPANSVYTFIYINGKFHLVGDLDQVNNGMTVYETDMGTSQGGFIPVLSQAHNPNGVTGKSITCEVNYDYPISVNSEGFITFSQGAWIHDHDGHGWKFQNPHSGDMVIIYPYEIAIHDGDSDMRAHIRHDGGDIEIYNDDSYMSLRNNTLYTDNVSASLLTGAQVWQAGRRVPNVWYGTTPPDSSIGQDGDIYIMYS